MPRIVSHGAWARHPRPDGMLGFRRGETDWYDYAHGPLSRDPDTVKILVEGGIVRMVERDATALVPPGEVFEAPAGFAVERGWRWLGDRFIKPEPEAGPSPVERLAAFLRANPDVRALIGGDA